MKYGIICEDIAHLTFIDKFLKVLHEQKYNSIEFIIDEDYNKSFLSRNNTKVYNLYPNAVIQAFRDFDIDIMFVGIDYDKKPIDKFTDNYLNLYNRVHEMFRQKTIIFFPVKAIEHWLWYLKLKKENPSFNKNITLENKSNREAKIELYNNTNPKKEFVIEIVSEFTSNMNIDWLITRSISFNSFFQKLKSFLETKTDKAQ